MRHSAHTESALHLRALTRATHTHHATARVASLARNPGKHVVVRLTQSTVRSTVQQVHAHMHCTVAHKARFT